MFHIRLLWIFHFIVPFFKKNFFKQPWRNASFIGLFHWLKLKSCFLYSFFENKEKWGWDKSPSLSIVFGLSSKTQWLSGLYYADFISFYSPTQLCGGGTTKSNSNELPISVPLSFVFSLWMADNQLQVARQGPFCDIARQDEMRAFFDRIH